jgi:hypothetical protein
VKGFICWTVSFFFRRSVVLLQWLHKQLKQLSVECWKPTRSAQNSSTFIGDWRVVGSVSKTNCGTIVFWGDNAERYQNLLTQLISLLEENERGYWFQQDGATAHAANTTALQQEFSGEHTVGRGLWPPQSPDLTPPDFFMWGFLKDRIYSNNPWSLEKLKHNIEQTVANIGQETLRIVARNTLKRVDACLWERGGYFQHLL